MRALTVLIAPRSFSHAAGFSLPPVGRWMRVAAERRRLAALSDEALKDLGISRAEADAEASRPFWDTACR